MIVAVPSSLRVTVISLQYPARCSSTALSAISYIRWLSPLVPTLPIYIPGLFLTASRPSRIDILFASYFSAIYIL